MVALCGPITTSWQTITTELVQTHLKHSREKEREREIYLIKSCLRYRACHSRMTEPTSYCHPPQSSSYWLNSSQALSSKRRSLSSSLAVLLSDLDSRLEVVVPVHLSSSPRLSSPPCFPHVKHLISCLPTHWQALMITQHILEEEHLKEQKFRQL